MPTREEAIKTLYQLINSDVLSDEIAEKLEDIAKCIGAEDEQNIFIWGVEDNDWAELYIAYRSDLWTDELKARMKSIYEKYKIQEVNGE